MCGISWKTLPDRVSFHLPDAGLTQEPSPSGEGCPSANDHRGGAYGIRKLDLEARVRFHESGEAAGNSEQGRPQRAGREAVLLAGSRACFVRRTQGRPVHRHGSGRRGVAFPWLRSERPSALRRGFFFGGVDRARSRERAGKSRLSISGRRLRCAGAVAAVDQVRQRPGTIRLASGPARPLTGVSQPSLTRRRGFGAS